MSSHIQESLYPRVDEIMAKPAVPTPMGRDEEAESLKSGFPLYETLKFIIISALFSIVQLIFGIWDMDEFSNGKYTRCFLFISAFCLIVSGTIPC